MVTDVCALVVAFNNYARADWAVAVGWLRLADWDVERAKDMFWRGVILCRDA